MLKDIAKKHQNQDVPADDLRTVELKDSYGHVYEIPQSEYDALVEITKLYDSTPENEKLQGNIPIENGHVTWLSIWNKDITYLPESISKLEHLKRLSIGSNSLESLPESIGYLEDLESLSIEYNNIKEIPESLYGMKNLKTFTAYGNDIDTPTKQRLRKTFKRKVSLHVDDYLCTDEELGL